MDLGRLFLYGWMNEWTIDFFSESMLPTLSYHSVFVRARFCPVSYDLRCEIHWMGAEWLAWSFDLIGIYIWES